MWGMSIEEIDSSILSRVPVRDDLNEYYFPNDEFQALPSNGYSELFINILRHPNIRVELNKPFTKGEELDYYHTFNSMPIDEYFEFKFGYLPYRSIRFHTNTVMIPQLFPVGTVNFTHKAPYTRITEWKNLPNSGKSDYCTTFTIEEPCDYKDNNFERYYPVKDKDGENKKLYKRYQEIIPSNMTFIGRCGLYAYLDMHQAISNALSTCKDFINQDQVH
jgi:UDP-galactopyranose mutase